MYLNPKGKQGCKSINMEAPASQYRPDIEITLDTAEDLELLRFIYAFEGQGYNLELTPEQIIGIINDYPMMYSKVKEIHRKDYFSELQEWYAKTSEVQTVKISEEVKSKRTYKKKPRGKGKKK